LKGSEVERINEINSGTEDQSVDQSIDQSWIRGLKVQRLKGSRVQRLRGLMRLIVDQRINRGSKDHSLIPLINADPN